MQLNHTHNLYDFRINPLRVKLLLLNRKKNTSVKERKNNTYTQKNLLVSDHFYVLNLVSITSPVSFEFVK